MKNVPPNELDVVFLPESVPPESLEGKTVVVVDVLRATTTIITALSNGCSQVLPQPSVDLARDTYQAFPNSAVIGGERGGKIVDGFHHGNSPLEYTSKNIDGKTLILTTTNGTVAMEHCRLAKRVLIGAMINVDAIAKAVLDDPKTTVVCSGTDRVITSEDVLFAGALVDRVEILCESNQLESIRLTDTAKIARDHWKAVQAGIDAGGSLADVFRIARGGIHLVKIGHDPDIVYASQLDICHDVPELNLEKWSIRLIE
ncbi:MAG: 2-phosphosulfolactate phosphatase [Planctomycetota bacterium]